MADSPSETVKTFAGIKGAVDNSTGPRYGRPSERFGPPAVLFNEELAFLKYYLDHLETFAPSSSTAFLASALIDTATAFFDEEGRRESSLRPTLQGLIAGTVKWQHKMADGPTKPGGVWLEDLFAYLILEIKNEPGLGGDPFLQGLIVYNKIVTQEKVRSISLASPCFAKMLLKVHTVSEVIKSTGCPHRAGGEPSHHICCCFHRRRICRRATLDYPPCRTPRFKRGTLHRACVHGSKQVCRAASRAVWSPSRNRPISPTGQSFVAQPNSRPNLVRWVGLPTGTLLESGSPSRYTAPGPRR